jgi:hypothetical protein
LGLRDGAVVVEIGGSQKVLTQEAPMKARIPTTILIRADLSPTQPTIQLGRRICGACRRCRRVTHFSFFPHLSPPNNHEHK